MEPQVNSERKQRSTRRQLGENLGAPSAGQLADSIAPDLSCAVGVPPVPMSHYPRLATRFGRGNPHAWLKSGADTRALNGLRCARRDPPPLRFGAALFCVVSRLEACPRRRLCEVGSSPYRFLSLLELLELLELLLYAATRSWLLGFARRLCSAQG